MRLLGRLLTVLLVVALLTVVYLLVRSAEPLGLTSRAAPGRWIGGAQPSLAYIVGPEASTFVLSRPQNRVRLLTNAELARGAEDPRYGLKVEALDATGDVYWSRDIYVRTVPLDVQDESGNRLPHAFIRESGAGRLSAGDVTVIELEQPASAVRISAAGRDAGVLRMLVRVQEQRPMSERQQEVGWDRLSRREREQQTAGNPLGSALLTAEERRNLIVRRWSPVGPAGVEGRDYRRTLIYERPGAVLPVTNRGNR